MSSSNLFDSKKNAELVMSFSIGYDMDHTTKKDHAWSYQASNSFQKATRPYASSEAFKKDFSLLYTNICQNAEELYTKFKEANAEDHRSMQFSISLKGKMDGNDVSQKITTLKGLNEFAVKAGVTPGDKMVELLKHVDDSSNVVKFIADVTPVLEAKPASPKM